MALPKCKNGSEEKFKLKEWILRILFVRFSFIGCNSPGSPTTIFNSKVYPLPKGTTIFKMGIPQATFHFVEFMSAKEVTSFKVFFDGKCSPITQFWWVSCFHSDHIHPSAVVLFVTFQKLMQDPSPSLLGWVTTPRL